MTTPLNDDSTVPRSLRVAFEPVSDEPDSTYQVTVTAPDGTIVGVQDYTLDDVVNGVIPAEFDDLDPDVVYTVDLQVTTPAGTFPLDTMQASPPGGFDSF